jgi:hypothetical protein
MRGRLLGYLRPGFHPLQHDDQPLLERLRPQIEGRLLEAATAS